MLLPLRRLLSGLVRSRPILLGPPTPAGLAASASGAAEIDLTWTAVPGALGYRVERSADGSAGWARIASPATNSYADTGLTGSTTYYYRVSSYNAVADSPPSNVANATTGSSGPVQVLSDTFTDTNGTLLSAHSPDLKPAGSVWDLAGSLGFDIQANKARPLCVSDAYSFAAIEAGAADVLISADITWHYAANRQQGLILRWQDANNFWAAKLSPAAGLLVIIERNAGVETVRDSVAPTLGATNNLQFISSGNNLSVLLDGVPALAYVSAFLNNKTKVGLYSYNDNAAISTARWDNLLVDA